MSCAATDDRFETQILSPKIPTLARNEPISTYLPYLASRLNPFAAEINSMPALAIGNDTILDIEPLDIDGGIAITPDGALGFCNDICFGPFSLNVSSRLLVRDGTPIAIGGRALDLLIALTARAGEILSVRELLTLVWPTVVVEDANLRVCVAALRKALGDGKDGARYIVNVAGRGYTFVAPIRRMTAAGDESVFLPAQATRSTLPAPAPLLIGRNETIDALSLQVLSRRVVTVVGPGGIGKTTVAIAVANALRDKFADDATCFIDLGLQTDPAAVSHAVAMALSCHRDGFDPVSSLVAFLSDKRMLILLDNCEHLIEAVAPLAERLFRETPKVHLLATSREALRVDGEVVHLILPLGCPPIDAPSAEQALDWPAVQLFMERAASSGHRSELSEVDARIVSDICRRVDGIPLAIELVASRVGAFGIRGIADLMDNCAEILLQGRRSVVPRHQSMQAVLDWSFNLLSAYEQKVFCRLSTFVGPFELEAAQNVAGDNNGERQVVCSAIASLVDKCLLEIWLRDGKTYLRFLHTTRTYAAARLLETGETEAVARRHAAYFAALLEANSSQDLPSPNCKFDVLAPHIDNVRQALAWSVSQLQ